MFGAVLPKAVGFVLMAAVLAGCKSNDERAEEYYQSGLSLIEAGDTDRALVELRNVFQLNGEHREARTALANIYLANGNRQEAYSQYLRLAEQYPDDVDTRLLLSELALESQNWDELERHGTVLQELAPDLPRTKALTLARTYLDAVKNEDAAERRDILRQVQALQSELPDSPALRNILIDGYSREGTYDKALIELDKLIAASPGIRRYYDQRLSILARQEDADAIETQLREMLELFPEDQRVKAMVVRFYLAQGDTGEAEEFLRSISDPAAEEVGPFMDLVRFVMQTRGRDAARIEIERGIAENPNPNMFVAMLAGLDFEDGNRDEAVQTLESLLADAEPSEQKNQINMILARMLITQNNLVGARRIVEEVLAADDSQVEALKMQAVWQTDADDTDGAIANLRRALDKEPEDAQAMTLMAAAYVRAGNQDLARDFLALAVEASGNAAEESLRYAQLLISNERYLPAEDVLLPALKREPSNAELLTALGQLYLAMEDSSRAQQVMETLRRLGGDLNEARANDLQLAILNQQSGPEEAIAFIERLAGSEDADISAKVALARARLSTGEGEEARTILQTLVDENPGNLRLRLILATANSALKEHDKAEEIYRAILTEDPQQSAIWVQLSRTLRIQGKEDAARSAIDDGLAQNADNGELLWAKASYLERDQDFDSAIDIYESLYEANPGSVVVANNLASLITTYRDDEASLERAYVIARRLKGQDVPALQDTYGWIAFRRGDAEEALPYLESAAAGLPNDPLVQIHLATVYASLERKAEAITQYERAVEIAGPADTRPQIETARTEIDRLKSEAAE